jgi:hypothetical protein
MGFHATKWAMQVTGLSDMAHWVLARIAWSVLDDDGVLDHSPNWLADKTHMSERGLRRQILALEKLHLVRRIHGGGYLLTGFRETTGQNRPLFRQLERSLERSLERPKMATATILRESSESREMKLASSDSFWPSDEPGQVAAIGKHYGVPEDLARAVLFTGLARHSACGVGDPIRSVKFFAGTVGDLRSQLQRGGKLSPQYLEYLKAKLTEIPS